MAADTIAVHFPTARPPDSTHTLVGIYYVAAVQGLAPLAILLHGFPGAEKNHDLAHHLRGTGWHVLVVHFSGAWGSGGNYQIDEQVIDAQAGIDYALDPLSPARIDPTRIALVGYSLGSRAALLAAVTDDRVGAVVSIAGISDFSDVIIPKQELANSVPFFNGVDVEELDKQWRDLGNGMQPAEAVDYLRSRPVLVVHGTDDEVVWPIHADMLSEGQREHVWRNSISDANHTFAGHRAQLIEAVSDFLKRWRNDELP
jgi:pimeloyl-ACP methyl ester carboxylesterase